MKKRLKVFVNRVDKEIYSKISDFQRDLGGVVLKNFGNLLRLTFIITNANYVNVKEYVYVYVKDIKTLVGFNQIKWKRTLLC